MNTITVCDYVRYVSATVRSAYQWATCNATSV